MAEESDLTPTERALQSNDWQKTEARPSEESNQFFQGPSTSNSKQSSRQTWLVVFLSLAGSVFIAVVVISVCLFGKCRKNCRKQQRTGITLAAIKCDWKLFASFEYSTQ